MIQAFGPVAHLTARMCATMALGCLLLTEPAAAQAPASGQPKPGGFVRIGTITEPSTLNPYFTGNIVNRAVEETSLEGLARISPDGTYLPVLAEEVPTQANDDVSADGTVVTWKLKHGVTWSDGNPFTSQDVVFTYQMIMDPGNPVASRSDYTVMRSVTAPDAYTVLVTYAQIYAPYRGAFQWVLPMHVFGGETNISQVPFNRAPIGTGPFVFRSWAAGDTIEFDRNQRYREAGKPYLDGIIYQITPSFDAAIQALEAGDLDVVWKLSEAYIPQFETITDASIDTVPSTTVEKLVLNASCPSGPKQGDPSCPHPVLGDLRVRQAIALATEKQMLTQAVMFGRGEAANSLLPLGPYPVRLPPAEYNPDKANQLLDLAGWSLGPDGIRINGGVRAHLTLLGISGDALVAQAEQLIQQDLQSVGIELEIKNLPAAVLLGGFPGNSPQQLGSFDMTIYAGSPVGDPQSYFANNFGSDQVANQQTRSGANISRIQDPELDSALTAAASTLDDTARLAAYTRVMQLINADAGSIPLFTRLQIDAHKNYLAGWQANVNDYSNWNAQDWWLNQ